MNYIRRLLQTVRVAPSDEELGRRTSVYPTADQRRSSHITGEETCPVIETSEKLVEFRLLVGITTHGSFKAPRGFGRNQRPIVTTAGRPAPNTGIYVIVVDNEIKSKKLYKSFSVLINSCLGIQIIVAAALTALGAADGSRSAVTVFGAINTVIAGFLTYLKGSGLPNRFKYFQHEWGKIREYIEQRERDLSIDNSLDVRNEVYVIRKMYEEVRADVEANQPDRFVSSGTLGRKPVIVAPGPPLAGGRAQLHNDGDKMHRLDSGLDDMLMRMKEKAVDREKEVEAFGSAASSEAHNIRAHVAGDIGRLKSVLQEKMDEVAHIEKELTYHGRKVVEGKEAEVENIAEPKLRYMRELDKDVEFEDRRAVESKEHEFEVKTTGAVVDTEGKIKATLEVYDPFREEKSGL